MRPKSVMVTFAIMAGLTASGCASTTMPSGPTSENVTDPNNKVCMDEAKSAAEAQKAQTEGQIKKNAAIGGGAAGGATVLTGIGFGLDPLSALIATAPLIVSAAAGSGAIPAFYGSELKQVYDEAYNRCIAERGLRGKPAS
jgi:hypothetical protein